MLRSPASWDCSVSRDRYDFSPCRHFPYLPYRSTETKRFFFRWKKVYWNSNREKFACYTSLYSGKVEAMQCTSGNMIFAPIMEDGVFRFDCSSDDRAAALPSFSFLDNKLRDNDIQGNSTPSFVPTFELHQGHQIGKLELHAGTSFYGTGEVSGQLERTGKRIFTWNTDAWGYGPGTTSLYQSHPWVLAVLPNGDALGVLADTTRRCEIDLRTASVIRFVSSPSYSIITFGPFHSPEAVLESLSRAIGTVFMPPKWSLGYHQCRWSYDSEERVKEIARTFRAKDIPCDVVWMDIDYMDGFRCFTFNKKNFPNAKRLVEYLHENGMKAIWMLDPGIKFEENYFVYQTGSKIDAWVKQCDGSTYIGDVWPGPCVFPDFTQSKVRSWWADLVKKFLYNGVDGIWNDMNEPAVFKTVTKTMPESNTHRGDNDLGGFQNHSYYHNVYGLLMARSTYEGMIRGASHKRPFVLTRAGYLGSQRYAATWTGDNLSTWEHLRMSISMVIQLGLSGQPFSGPDIGGFAGNASPKLFGGWMGVGSMFPFCRGHSEKSTNDHEPWSFGEECEEVCRLALKRRYRLIPYLYTMMYLAHKTGRPMVTPTFFADTKDPNLRKIENSFLLGKILVDASYILNEEAELPKGTWLRFDFQDSHPDLPTLYLQSGSIIPYGSPYNHVGEWKATDDLHLLIALNHNGKAEGCLYEDDGDGNQFSAGEYLFTHYVAETDSSVVRLKIAEQHGSWSRPDRKLHVHILLGGSATINVSGVDGQILQVSMPPEEVKRSVIASSEELYKSRLGKARCIPDEVSEGERYDYPRAILDLKNQYWDLKLVPWIGGRIMSLVHLPTGVQWLAGRVEMNGYEEYSSTELRSAGCSEEYRVLDQDEESVSMEGDVGGGLAMRRKIFIEKENGRCVHISSSIVARHVGAGSGGFSRIVCLRVHPTFSIMHPSETSVRFTSVDGVKREIVPGDGNCFYEGGALPNGEWRLVDACVGVSLVNRFDLSGVLRCCVSWGTMAVHMDLLSEERPVSDQTPLSLSHSYEVITFDV